MEREAVTSWLKGLLASLHGPGSPEASVALYLPKGEGMTRYAIGGTDAETLFEAHIPNAYGPYHFCFAEGEPLYLPDAQEEDRVMECYLNTFAEVIAPVSAPDQRAVGILVARRRGPVSFKSDEVSAVIAWAKKFPE